MRWGLLVCLAGVLGLLAVFSVGGVLPAYGQDTATPTETPEPTITLTPTVTVTATPINYDVPQWPGAWWSFNFPTVESPAGCVDVGYALDFFDNQEVIDPRWAAACSYCLPEGGAAWNDDPIATLPPWGGGFSTPTPTPLAGSNYYLSNFVEWSREFEYDIQIVEGMDPIMWYDKFTTWPEQSAYISGLVFDAVHTGAGGCVLQLVSDVTGSLWRNDWWVEEGSYCLGPAEACLELAPGSMILTSYAVIPPGQVVGTHGRIGNQPVMCTPGDTWHFNN